MSSFQQRNRVGLGGDRGAGAAFQIDRTPPDESSRRLRASEAEANSEVTLLVLTPFTAVPKVSFDNVKLGKSAVRKITVQNPSGKPVKVSLQSFQSQNGFEVDYDSFTMGPREETTLTVGWVPLKEGNVREKIAIKYDGALNGGMTNTHIILVASCVDKVTKRPTFSSKAVTGKLAVKPPCVPRPNNPVIRMSGQQPELRPMPMDAENQPPKLKSLPSYVPEPSWSPQKLFDRSAVEATFRQQPLSPVKQHNGELQRRDTYAIGDPSFTSSTPAMSKNANAFKEMEVSAIRVMRAAVAPTEKRSSCKELMFNEPQTSPPPDEETVVPWETFDVTEVKAVDQETTDDATQVLAVFEEGRDDCMTPMDVSNMLQRYLDFDRSVTNTPKTAVAPIKNMEGDSLLASPLIFEDEMNLEPYATKQAVIDTVGENEAANGLQSRCSLSELQTPENGNSLFDEDIPPPSEQDVNVSMMIQKMLQDSYCAATVDTTPIPMSDSRETYIIGAVASPTGLPVNFCLEEAMPTTTSEDVPTASLTATANNLSQDSNESTDSIEKLEVIVEMEEDEDENDTPKKQSQQQSEPGKLPEERVSLHLSGALLCPSEKTNLADSRETYVVGNLSPQNLSLSPKGDRMESVIAPASQRAFETFQVTPPPRQREEGPSFPKRGPAAAVRVAKTVPARRTAVDQQTKSRQPPRLTLIKPMKGMNAIRHPNPFASKNIYYDEKWVQKQESGFQKWLYFILTPNTFDANEEGGSSSSLQPGKVDTAKVWKACSSDARVPRAPTREVMSVRAYTARRAMNRLRREARSLWHSPGIAQVIKQVEIEIERKRFSIRADKCINKDSGLKKKFLELVLSYNPLWLQIGLETIFGEILAISGVPDVVELSQYVLTRVLSSPDIQAEYAHDTVPHHYKSGYEAALKQFTLRKFLQLVYFLDKAKSYRLIMHDPCLFRKDSKVKSSQIILTTFSRDFLAGEGDVIKHLAYLGYEATHKQSVLSEFDYAVTNLAHDLKDGVRLCRVVELLGNDKLAEKLRMPAQARLQKVHNVEVALQSLRAAQLSLPDITARCIVDGDLEKTLGLVWHIIFGLQLDKILSEDRLRKEIIRLEKSLKYRMQIGDSSAKRGFSFILEARQRDLVQDQFAAKQEDWISSSRVKLLLQWARLVCAHYGLEVENLSVSFSDGRALCLLLHHYYPTFLPRADIEEQTTVSQQQSLATPSNLDCSLDDSFGTQTYSYSSGQLYQQLLKNEKKNFKLFHDKTNDLSGVPLLIRGSEMSNTIPDQKVTTVFLTYLAARLLDLSAEMAAAKTIQNFWRKFRVVKKKRELLQVKYSS